MPINVSVLAELRAQDNDPQTRRARRRANRAARFAGGSRGADRRRDIRESEEAAA